jgi:hypothetical protein
MEFPVPPCPSKLKRGQNILAGGAGENPAKWVSIRIRDRVSVFGGARNLTTNILAGSRTRATWATNLKQHARTVDIRTVIWRALLRLCVEIRHLPVASIRASGGPQAQIRLSDSLRNRNIWAKTQRVRPRQPTPRSAFTISTHHPNQPPP